MAGSLPPLYCMCGAKVVDPSPDGVSDVLHICERPECFQAAKTWVEQASAMAHDMNAKVAKMNGELNAFQSKNRRGF